MKKRLALFLAFVLTITMVIPALADNPTGDTTIVEYTVDSKYTITIPEKITLTDGTGSDDFSVNADSLIDAATNLYFTITAATHYAAVGTYAEGFKMQNASDTTVYLDYSIKDGADAAVVMNTPFLVASATECYAGKTVNLTYTTGTVVSAGIYSDTITITVAESATVPVYPAP